MAVYQYKMKIGLRMNVFCIRGGLVKSSFFALWEIVLQFVSDKAKMPERFGYCIHTEK